MVKVSKNLAYALMVLAAIMWATSGTLTELALDAGAEVLQVTLFQMIVSAMILLPLIALLDPRSLKIRREDFWPLLAFSLITGTFFSLAWYACVERTGVATAVILLYSYPSIVVLSSVFLLGEKLGPEKAVALPMTFVGCILVAGAQDIQEGLSFDLIGVALGVYTGVAAAIYYLWGKKFLARYSANTLVLYMTLLSIPGLVIIANPLSVADNPLGGMAWLYIFLLGLLPGSIGFLVSMVALKHIEASRASIIASIEPVAAVLIAFAVLSQALTAWQAVGVALVFIAVLLIRLREEPEEAKQAGPLER